VEATGGGGGGGGGGEQEEEEKIRRPKTSELEASAMKLYCCAHKRQTG
jgi:hypothetical protein